MYDHSWSDNLRKANQGGGAGDQEELATSYRVTNPTYVRGERAHSGRAGQQCCGGKMTYLLQPLPNDAAVYMLHECSIVSEIFAHNNVGD